MGTSTPKPERPPMTSPSMFWLGRAAVLAALLAMTILSIRTICNFDIGYHLAYGEHFFQTGRIAQTPYNIYTVPEKTSAEFQKANPPGPGCWYDDDGQYRFPNANWLTQLLFCGVWKIGGFNGLSVMLAASVILLAVLAIYVMRELHIPTPMVGAGLLLIALTAYERFNLRPELMSYIILIAQLAVWVKVRPHDIMSTKRIAALVALQWLLVNVHSYWLLGLGLTVAWLVGSGVHGGIDWIKTGKLDRRLRRPLIRLLILLVLQVLVGFINPFGWRLMALPFQTLAYFRLHGITDQVYRTGLHPWSVIGEFFFPLHAGFADQPATWAYAGLLGITAVAGVVGLATKRFRFVLVMLGFVAISLSMRRNIAVAGIIVTPLVIACLTPPLRRRLRGRIQSVAVWSVSLIVILLAGAIIWGVVTQRFYTRLRRPARFGVGLGQTNLPASAANFLNTHKPAGTLFCDFDDSSNLYFLTESRPKVPLLTNTWVIPPNIMDIQLRTLRGARAFALYQREHNPQIIVLRLTRFTAEPDLNAPSEVPLALQLSAGMIPGFSLVHLDANHAVFLNEQANSKLIRQFKITRANFDVAAYIHNLKTADPTAPAMSIYQGGRSLSLLGWNKQAVEVLHAAVEMEPSFWEAWYEMGVCRLRLAEQTGNIEHVQEAAKALQKADAINPAHPGVTHHLKTARKLSK